MAPIDRGAPGARDLVECIAIGVPSRAVIRVLALLVAASTSVIAQSYLAGVRGAVRDATGVMVSVEVVLRNEDTLVARATLTNASGEYAFPSVAPGLYTIRAAAAGFRTFESRGIRIGTQDYLTLDLVLELGEVRESIVVTGGTPVIEHTNASVSAKILVVMPPLERPMAWL